MLTEGRKPGARIPGYAKKPHTTMHEATSTVGESAEEYGCAAEGLVWIARIAAFIVLTSVGMIGLQFLEKEILECSFSLGMYTVYELMRTESTALFVMELMISMYVGSKLAYKLTS